MHVIVVGAGPSGLVLCLVLAKSGIQVTLLDAAPALDDRPRAAHYAPCAIRELNRAGVLEDVRTQGFIPGDMCWRRSDNSLIVKLEDSSQHNNPEALTVLPLNFLGKILLRHAERQPNIDIKWNHNVTNVTQDSGKASAHVTLPDATETVFSADYLCGCDGANSQVRRSLFGENFAGKTWNAQIVATNVYYPFEQFGYEDINFIIHPENFYMAARITQDGLWRVSYGEKTELGLQEVLHNQPAKFMKMLPGNPTPDKYKLLNCNPYRIHQRAAEKFRVGRICLAADAAHLCNPFGGLGLTGGLVDVGGLADCLIGIDGGYADDSILEKYDEIRRHIYHTIIDPVSSSNFLRVSAPDADTVAATDEVIELFRRANTDAAVKKEVDQSSYAICHDYKQYYNTRKETELSAGLTT